MNDKRATALSWLIIAAAVATLGWMNWRRHAGDGAYPSRPVRLICPYAPGGGTDLLCRVLAHEAEQRIGRPVLVDNVTGGGGAVGFAAGQLAPPDGYTALMTTFELVSLPVQGLAPFTFEDFDLVFGTWRGLALPKGVPTAARGILRDTFRAVVSSDALAAFAAQSGMNLRFLEGDAFREMVRQQAVEVAQMMKRVGLAK